MSAWRKILLLVLLGYAQGLLAEEQIDLEGTSIRGNRALPKVLYIVPWKSPGSKDLVGKPVNSLLDEALEPVQREVFRRQVDYFELLEAPKK